MVYYYCYYQYLSTFKCIPLVFPGESRASLHFQNQMGKSTINLIIAEINRAIYFVLKDDHLHTPNCLGSLDGKRIYIQKPKNSGSHFYNDKNRCSIVLLALVDANLKFLYIDVGTNRRVSDGGLFNKSCLKKAVDSNYLNMPVSGFLPSSTIQ